ncbi:MAG: hypothetical protein ACREUY_01760 [Burkholderiales bacterium]
MPIPKLILFLILLFQPLLAVAADCTPTRQTFLGNNYKPITTHKTDVGEDLRIQGRVLASKNCQPIAGTRIEHWQANAEETMWTGCAPICYQQKMAATASTPIGRV